MAITFGRGHRGLPPRYSMGRETKILLGLLGLLAGVFLGVLSMKLLVPRPPAGTGPDVHADLASNEQHDLVEPPRFGMKASDFASAPPLAAAAQPASPDAAPVLPATSGSRFGLPAAEGAPAATAAIPADLAAADPVDQPALRDPFVSRTAFEAEAVATPLPPAPAAVGPMAGSAYVVQDGDSWWSVAERAYGDGRLYRALFAWNRNLNPRITLAAGTPLEIPSRSRLAVAWPRFMPQD